MRKILFVTRDEGGCAWYRCRQPADFLKRAGFFDTEVAFRKPTEEQLLSADLVVMQEMGSVNASGIGRFLIEHRIPYLTEFDDFIHHVSPHNLAGYGGWNPSTLMTHRAMELARAGLGIQVSTGQLAREFFPYNPLIYVIPNWLDRDAWDIPISRRSDGKVRIGWAGGNAHADDLKMISKVIEDILHEYHGKVIFETFGMMPHELSGVFGIHHSSPETCQKCGHEGLMHHYPGEPLKDYPMHMAAKGWDIALAPVINNAFGNAKSDIKLKEYSAMGIPAVASSVQPYVEAGKNGLSVSFADTYDGWYTAIKELIDDSELRERRSREAKEWSANNWIQDRISEIASVYGDVLSLAEARGLGRKK